MFTTRVFINESVFVTGLTENTPPLCPYLVRPTVDLVLPLSFPSEKRPLVDRILDGLYPLPPDLDPLELVPLGTLLRSLLLATRRDPPGVETDPPRSPTTDGRSRFPTSPGPPQSGDKPCFSSS